MAPNQMWAQEQRFSAFIGSGNDVVFDDSRFSPHLLWRNQSHTNEISPSDSTFSSIRQLISHTLNFSRSLHHIQITNITSPQLAIAIRNPGLFRRWKRWP